MRGRGAVLSVTRVVKVSKGGKEVTEEIKGLGRSWAFCLVLQGHFIENHDRRRYRRSTVRPAVEASHNCRRVTKETTFIQSIIYSKHQPLNQYLLSACSLPAILVPPRH